MYKRILKGRKPITIKEAFFCLLIDMCIKNPHSSLRVRLWNSSKYMYHFGIKYVVCNFICGILQQKAIFREEIGHHFQNEKRLGVKLLQSRTYVWKSDDPSSHLHCLWIALSTQEVDAIYLFAYVLERFHFSIKHMLTGAGIHIAPFPALLLAGQIFFLLWWVYLVLHKKAPSELMAESNHADA